MLAVADLNRLEVALDRYRRGPHKYSSTQVNLPPRHDAGLIYEAAAYLAASKQYDRADLEAVPFALRAWMERYARFREGRQPAASVAA